MVPTATPALAEAIADQFGIDMTTDFVTQIDLIRYRLFLAGFVVRPLKKGRSRPPAGFLFPAVAPAIGCRHHR